ncbi:MAG: anaerobic ribonucleoside-triphosphate reductase activating protein [Puniceicoccales bacterium]|jgi:pyruvate formate lyase activating enzyme|nr:anaerobic ribonucleoside-triphosphate reductase activating protein [Puniceicoccales bacterium]
MIFGGWQKCTLIDFPGKVAAILFTQGCNFRCPYCHNHGLWPRKTKSAVEWDVIREFLKTRRGKLDGVVISGGEPTLHGDLLEILAEIRELGFATKLDTNGNHPHVLAKLLKANLLDFVAMDLKHLPAHYPRACGVDVALENILHSVKLIRESPIDHEFRTTVVPGLHNIWDLPALVPIVRSARRFTLQNFVPTHAADAALRGQKPFDPTELEELRPVFEPIVEIFTIR